MKTIILLSLWLRLKNYCMIGIVSKPQIKCESLQRRLRLNEANTFNKVSFTSPLQLYWTHLPATTYKANSRYIWLKRTHLWTRTDLSLARTNIAKYRHRLKPTTLSSHQWWMAKTLKVGWWTILHLCIRIQSNLRPWVQAHLRTWFLFRKI